MTTETLETAPAAPAAPIAPSEPVEPVSAAPATVEGQGAESPEGTAPATVDTAGSEPAFKVSDLPEWQEAVRTPTEPVKPAELPGEDLESFRARESQGRAQKYSQIIQQAHLTIPQQLAEEFQLTQAESIRLWNKYVAPLANDLHGNNYDYQQAVWNEAAKTVLAKHPDDLAAFFGRRFTNETEVVSALVVTGERRKEAEWKARVDKGDYIPRTKAESIATAAYNKGRGQREKAGEVDGAESGNVIEGRAPGSTTTLNEQNASTLPIGELMAIRNRQRAAG